VRLRRIGNRLGDMPEQRSWVDYGLIGALADIGFALVLAAMLAVATDWTGDAAPRPLVIAALYATPGIIGMIGVVAQRPWLLVAAALPLFPAAGLSFSGATLVFLLPAALMVVGAMRMAGRPEVPRFTIGNAVAAAAIVVLVVLAGWSVLIGLTVSACHPIAGGQACGSGYIATNGLIVAGVCLLAALAIAVVGARTPKFRPTD
jgi:hypothetical protein